MSFFQRLVSYVINDVAVKALSNSRAFQRFALKTHYHMEDAKTMASTSADVLKNSFETYAPKVKEFGEAFREELARDMKKAIFVFLKCMLDLVSSTSLHLLVHARHASFDGSV
ncbi:unnamed protein product [Peronospora farinosa]|uniref:Uncharacterized protein n=1 Tax=Peronospora farinosa TaxID=134698 RepID=A0AAV0UI55_9STRA|nr:unnamed protein product [Peronospora farinosa]CAI5735528.1 unnamed protein product [Peronospora farinosa]